MITHIERNTLLVQNTNGFTKIVKPRTGNLFSLTSSCNRPRPPRNQSSRCPAGPGKRKAKAPGNGKAKVAEAKGKRAQAARPHEMPRGTPRPLLPWWARAFRTVHGRHRPLRDAPVTVAVAGAPGPRATRRVSTPQPWLVRGPSGQCPQPRERIMAFS